MVIDGLSASQFQATDGTHAAHRQTCPRFTRNEECYHDYKVTVFEARVLFEIFFGLPLPLAIAGSPFLHNSSRLL